MVRFKCFVCGTPTDRFDICTPCLAAGKYNFKELYEQKKRSERCEKENSPSENERGPNKETDKSKPEHLRGH